MNEKKNSADIPRRQIFCDWHMPDFLPEIRIDYDRYFDGIKRTGAQALIFMAKSAHGTCLFPSNVGFTNKTMKGDIFGEVSRRAKKAGLQFLAYYCIVLSYELAKSHPEWRQINEKGELASFGQYPASCMTNDEFREHVGEHIEEIVRNYDIDGFFLDLQYFMEGACYCESCRREFAAMYGYELKAGTLDTCRKHLDFITFKVKMRDRFMLMVVERCNALKPGLIWTWNHAGDPIFTARKSDCAATWMSGEAHPPNYSGGDLRCRFLKANGKPFVLMMPESQHSWGDWTVTTAESMKGLTALSLAHGGALNINHVPYPTGDYGGRVPDAVWNLIRETFSWVREREKYCIDKKTVPVVGCPISEHNIQLFRALGAVRNDNHLRYEYARETGSLNQILSESHIPLNFFYEEDADKVISSFRAVILPNLPYISPGFANVLRRYVRDGGILVATYQTSLLNEEGERLGDFALADIFGIHFLNVSPYSVSYMDRLHPSVAGAIPDMPHLLKDSERGTNPPDHVLYCSMEKDVEALAYITEPVIESDFKKGYHIYHEHSSPGQRTDYPVVTSRRYGAGRAIFLPVPFFPSYLSARSPFLKELFRVLLAGHCGLSEIVDIAAPVSVKAVLTQDDEGWLLHLIHLQKETDSMYLDVFERHTPIRVRLKTGWKAVEVNKCFSGEQIPFTVDGETVSFVVPSIRDYDIIRIRRAA